MGKLKPNMPRSWFSLPKSEQQAITEACSKAVHATVDHEEAELQKIWIKMAVIALHEVFGFGSMRCLRFIKHWKRLYRIISTFKTNEERDEWLKAKTDKIFRKGGYPDGWVDSLENGGKSA